ncbi:hypothetical protein [Hymenobacter ruricola]|uniref:Uncharacterized protein n=1 Tax=Hymenobacter ruricola TaxID=2791023 RepID=A0ABS0I9N2_9BACT|nr:hypothetical protein [Hymenobacter ruricola]MBF9223639.1 hypothetical protein [Hymenobacter ruricola]
MRDDLYAARLRAQLVAPMRQSWDLEAVPLTDFEWLNAGLLVRHRQLPATERPQPLFVALPAHSTDLGTGLRAAAAAAWLAGHEPPIGLATPLLRPGDHVFHDETIWKVEGASDAAGKVPLRRVSDNRARSVAATACRKLAAPFEFAGLLDDNRAGFRYVHYQAWLEKLLAGTRQAQRLFRMADKDSIPRPHGGLTIVVAPADAFRHFEETVLEKVPGLPLCWTRRLGGGLSKQLWGLPFAASITVVASVAEALELRTQPRFSTIKNWHLSVVGKAAVGSSLNVAQLVQAYAGQQWASLTFWGPDLGVGETPGCVVWPWSRTEALGPHHRPAPVHLTIVPLPAPPAPGLAVRVAAVRQVLDGLGLVSEAAPLAVRLPLVWHLLHRCLRYALPPAGTSSHARAYLAELARKVAECLESEELEDAFDDANRWRDLKPARTALQAAFADLLDYFQDHSPKYDTLRALAADALDEGRPVVVVADRETLVATQAVWRGVRGVEVLPLLNGADNVRQRLRKGSFSSDAVLLVPFLFNRDQLAELQTAPCPVRLVLLAGVEDGLYARTQASLHQQEQAQLRAGGRATVLGQTYEQLVPATEVAHPENAAPDGANGKAAVTAGQLDYFDELYAVGEARYASERQRGRASGQLFAMAFADGYRTELDGHTRVLRREPAETENGQANLVPCQVDELQDGDRIIFYENDQPKLIAQILRQHDRNGLVGRIDQASAVWQEALQQLAAHYPGTSALYTALQVHGGLDVGLQTLRHYLEGKRRFPGDPTTLPALLKLARHVELLDCRLLQPGEAEEVRHCRTKFHQLSIALGKGLSEEVLRYRLTGAKGSLLSKLEPDTLELVLLSAVERTVYRISPR